MMNKGSERITLSAVWREVLSLLSLEKGVFRTTRDLAVRPGETICGYLCGQRSHLTNPLRYLIFSAATVAGLMVLAASLADSTGTASQESSEGQDESSNTFDDIDQLLTIVVNRGEAEAATSDQRFEASLAKQAKATIATTLQEKSMELAVTWANAMLVAAMPVYALLTFIGFRNAQLNLAEHIVVNCFILGFQNALAIGLVVPGMYFNQPLMSVIYMAFSIVYQTWAWRRVFRLHGWKQHAVLVGVTVCSIVGYLAIQGILTALLLWISIDLG